MSPAMGAGRSSRSFGQPALAVRVTLVGFANYDAIGMTYGATRRPDHRIAAYVRSALGEASSVVNVGAGTGSYEPDDRQVVAVEPSRVMISQRPRLSAPVVQAVAESLPFQTDSFDAAMAAFTIHHWADPYRGLAELRRVARHRIVVLTTDAGVWGDTWLTRHYFPAIAELDRARLTPIAELLEALGGLGRVIPIPVPHDCQDGFTPAYWRRPWAYLDPAVRAGMSTFASIDEEARIEGLRRLEADLESGRWAEQFGHLLQLRELDAGQRLVITDLRKS
jgi:SAM-dependent methyltransferase